MINERKKWRRGGGGGNGPLRGARATATQPKTKTITVPIDPKIILDIPTEVGRSEDAEVIDCESYSHTELMNDYDED